MAQEEKSDKKKKVKVEESEVSDADSEEEGVKKTVKKIIRDIWDQ